MNITNTPPTEDDAWQSGTTFGSISNPLHPNTTYYFFARFLETDNHYRSDPSLGADIDTTKANLHGKPVISVLFGSGFVYNNTLTVDYSMLYADPPGPGTGGTPEFLGTLTFQWLRNGTTLIGENSSTYQIASADIGHTISVRITTANTEDFVPSDPTGTVLRRAPVRADLSPAVFTPETFDGSPHPIPMYPTTGVNAVGPASGISGLGNVTSIEYKLYGSADAWSSTARTNAGTYEVQVTLAAGTNYTGATINLGQFIINKATPTVDHLYINLPGDPPSNPPGPHTLDWDGGQHNADVEPATAWAESEWMGEITVYYSKDGSEPTDVAPSSPGTYQVTVNIEEGDNFVEVKGLAVGSFTIVGADIPSGNITANNVSTEYNRAYHGIIVSDNFAGGSEVLFRDAFGSYTLTASPTIRNVTDPDLPFEVHFRVIRLGPLGEGFNPYYGSATITITPLQLTWATSGTVADKVYNRSLDATIITNPTLGGVISGDTVSVVAGTAAFTSWDVDPAVAVNATGTWSIGGPSEGNYRAPIAQPSFNPAAITAKPLTITDVTAIIVFTTL